MKTKLYYYIDGAGKYQGAFDSDAYKKEGWVEILNPPLYGTSTYKSDGTWDETQGLRAEAYPSLTEQADMAYWDRQNGTTTLDDAISAVKLQFPKPKG